MGRTAYAVTQVANSVFTSAVEISHRANFRTRPLPNIKRLRKQQASGTVGTGCANAQKTIFALKDILKYLQTVKGEASVGLFQKTF